MPHPQSLLQTQPLSINSHHRGDNRHAQSNPHSTEKDICYKIHVLARRQTDPSPTMQMLIRSIGTVDFLDASLALPMRPGKWLRDYKDTSESAAPESSARSVGRKEMRHPASSRICHGPEVPTRLYRGHSRLGLASLGNLLARRRRTSDQSYPLRLDFLLFAPA